MLEGPSERGRDGEFSGWEGRGWQQDMINLQPASSGGRLLRVDGRSGGQIIREMFKEPWAGFLPLYVLTAIGLSDKPVHSCVIRSEPPDTIVSQHRCYSEGTKNDL